MKKNKIIDLFCGCGGLSMGFEQAGFDIALAIDFWKDAITTYNHNHKDKVGKCENIKDLTTDFLKDLKKTENIVGVIGGPPCQGYSTVGTRDINDPRNHLYLEFCRVVETIQPDFFLIENVKGLTTLNKGMFKDDILNRFGKLGYKVNYKIVNAADYGVPQNRSRVLFIGMKNNKFEFPIGITENHPVSSSEAISDLPQFDGTEEHISVTKYCHKPQTTYQKEIRGNSKTLYNHDFTIHTEQTVRIINMIKDGGKIRDLPPEYWDIRRYNKAFERMNSQLPSNTVDTGHRNYFHYNQNRIPTVRENARLQSFPDNFEFIGTKTSQYKQVGNAVPPKLAYEIAKEIQKQLGG